MLLNRHFALTLTTLLWAASLNATAQDERWYQVELLIFSQPAAGEVEQWDPLPALAYPETSRFLVNPEQFAARRADHQGPSKIDEFGRLWLMQSADTTKVDAGAPDIPRQAGIAPPNDADIAQPQSLSRSRLTPTPFNSLPLRDSEFYGKAAYMQRAGGYRTLFHESWVQPVRGESTAVPIIIDHSGDNGDWPQLQGSVKIHIARFLHLETNLWLNTPGNYFPANPWRMPAPPLGPLSVIVEEPEPEEDPYFVSAAPADPLLEEGETTIEVEASGPVYPWRHAVLLQQKRRMRSNEVHYIDHPLIGVVIKFTPLDEEQLQAMAAAESSASRSPN